MIVSVNKRYCYPLNYFVRLKTSQADESSKEKNSTPRTIIKLLFQKKGEPIAWPSVKHVSELTLRCCEAKTDILDVEAFFIKEYDKNKAKKNFFPPLLYTKWTQEKTDQYILQMLMQLEKLLQSKEKIHFPLRRALYVSTVWRLVQIFETCITENIDSGSNLVSNFSKRCSLEHSLQDIDIYLALAKLQADKELSIPVELHEPLAKLTRSIAYHPGGGNTFIQSFPRCLQYENYESMLNRLINDQTVDIKCKISFLLSLSALQWHKANFSSSLDSLSTATTLFIRNIDQQIYQSESEGIILKELCVYFCRLWFYISNNAAEKGMKPAIYHLHTQSQYFLSLDHPIGFLPSYFLLMAAELHQDSKLCSLLQPLVNTNDRSEDFEKFVKIPVTTNKNKMFHINNYIQQAFNNHHKRQLEKQELKEKQQQKQMEEKQLEVETTSLLEDKNENQSEFGVFSNEEIPLEIQKEMLDVRILELTLCKNGTGVLELYFENIKNGLAPGREAAEAIVQLFSSTEDIESLNLLFKVTPEPYTIRNEFYKEICEIKLRNIITRWQNDEKLDAWIQIIEFYRNLMDDRKNYVISGPAIQQTVKKCRQFCKLIIEDNMRRENQFLAALKSGSLRLASEHRDVYLLLTFWEALFFSTSYEHQTAADKLLEELPQLVQYMQIDSVVSRAEKYQTESYFRKLIELNLKYNGSDYNKSRSFEALLRFLTQNERLKAGDETIKVAKALNIRITADYMTDFLEMRKTKPLTSGSSIFNAFKSAFFKKKDE